MYQQALVVGKFAPLHRGHQLVIERALVQAQRVLVLCYTTPDFVFMPNQMRAGWIRAIYPDVDVRVPAGAPPDTASDEAHRLFVRGYLDRNGIAVDVVLTSEPYGEGFAAAIGARHICVDSNRAAVPVSGTALRAAPEAFGSWLHPLVSGDISGVSNLALRGSG